MDIEEIFKTGNEIVNSVDRHIANGDFSGLSKEIFHIAAGGERYSGSFQEKAQQINTVNCAAQPNREGTSKTFPNTFNEKAVKKASLTLKIGILILFAVIFAIAAIILFGAFSLGSKVCLVLGIICAAVLIYCIFHIRRFSLTKTAYDHLKDYAFVIGDRVWYDVDSLAAQCRQQPEDAVSTIQILIKAGCLPTAKLGADNKTLFMTADAYRRYTQDQDRRRREEQKVKQQTGSLPPQVQDLIRDGETYVAKIRSYNAAIPAQEFSVQLDRLEAYTRNVFDLVREDPSNAKNLRRMMDYYLPTTDKMLGAYIDLEKRRIPGNPNTEIVQMQREIEEAVGTMNTAFEKLLNDMIRAKSWDVRSDISAMETMMKQDGLV